MAGKWKDKGTRVFLILVLILVLSGGIASAQESIRLVIQDIDVGTFPYMEVYVSALSSQGDPIFGLTKDNFTVLEDANPVTDFQLNSVQNVQQTISFVIALDTSPSMEYSGADGTRLEDSVAAIKEFLGSIESHDEVALVTFGGSAKVIQELTTDISLINDKLDQVATEEVTNVYDGMMEAIMLLKDVETRPVILLLTDGMDSRVGTNTLEDALAAAKDNNIPIYPIGFGEVRDADLISIADETNGVASINEDTSGLKAAFSELLQTLREQYLIRYTSALPGDDASHTLEVGITYSGQTVSDSGEFIASLGVPPVEVKILEPSEGQVTGVPITINAEVTGLSSIASVEFFVDNISIGKYEASLDGTYSQVWETVQESGVGEHTIRVVGTDVSALPGEAEITVEVRPIVKILNPQEGDALKGEVEIELDIAPGFDTDKVIFYAKDADDVEVELGESTAAPFSFNWRLFDFKNGDYQLRAVAVDGTGTQGESSVSVRISQAGAVDKTGGGGSAFIIAIGVVVLVAGILIPLGLRKRKKSTGPEKPEEGEVAVLMELEGKNAGQNWPLAQPEVKLGRKSTENDIPLKGLSASRYMAMIRFGEKGYVIYSLNPDNPVIVNDQPIDRQYILQAGDVIKLGESIFKFERN